MNQQLMQRREQIARRKQTTTVKPGAPIARVYLNPQNEGQPLNYCQAYRGTAKEIIKECLRIITGLQSVLTAGSFSVLIENENSPNQKIIVTKQYLLDDDGEIIGNLEDFQI